MPIGAGVFLDFDGTLAPIVDDPATAVPDPRALAVLEALAARFERVAVISGRPVEYLQGRLERAAGITLVGLYGLERAVAGTGEVSVDPRAEPWRQVVNDAVGRARSDAPGGVTVEPKGLTVTLHFRGAPQQEAWVADYAGAVARRSGLEVHLGKMSVELRPPVSVDKGSALRELAHGLRAVLFAGDDLGDLPAFSAMRDLQGEGVETLTVVAGSEETPPQLIAAADVAADGVSGVLDVLAALIG